MTTAITTASFINSLGVNTHIDFDADGYQNLATVEAAINYLGLKNIRDSAQTASDASAWLQVANATATKFDDYIGETSPAGMSTDLGYVAQLAQEGILNYLEGGNEEDDSYPASLGNTLAYTAQFQQQIYATAHQYGLDAINMSFGAGWTAANDWHGDYDKVGNLSAYADFANAHTYPNVGQTADSSIQQLNGDALLAAGSRQVMTTELGWNASTFSQSAIAQYVVQAALDGIKDGDAKMYYYALFNDSSGNYGLMNSDGSATPAGTALHDLTTLLADTGSNAASFTPGSLNYSLSGQEATDNTLLMQKSNGSDWIAVWDESAATHTVTLNLPITASQIEVYDPVTGTSAIQSASNASSISLSLGNDPLLVEVIPSGSAASAGSTTTTSTGTTSTSTSSGSTTTSTSPDPVLKTPASETIAAGATSAITGVSLSDPWAAAHAGGLALNVTTSGGTVSMTNGSGTVLSGSGTSAIHASGTLAQINADLATLSYTAGSSNATLSVNVWDQSGAQATNSIGATIGSSSGSSGGSTATPASTASTSTIVISSNNADPVENVSNATITATAGDHLIFIGGTGNTLTATGGTETVQAFQGGNTITTGPGNDQIYYSGSNNVVNAGAGVNTLYDSGTNNTIVLPAAGQGTDNIYGYMMTNGDKFDLRTLLGSTSWNGELSTIGNYLSVTQSGTSAVINVDPSGIAGGASFAAATLEGAGPVSLSTLLAHSIT